MAFQLFTSAKPSYLCPVCQEEVKGGMHACQKMGATTEAKVAIPMFVPAKDTPPTKVLEAARTRGDSCKWEEVTELILISPGTARLELFRSKRWAGFVTRIEVLSNGENRAVVTVPSQTQPEKLAESRWVAGLLSKAVDLDRLTELTTLAGIPFTFVKLPQEADETQLRTPAPSPRAAAIAISASAHQLSLQRQATSDTLSTTTTEQSEPERALRSPIAFVQPRAEPKEEKTPTCSLSALFARLTSRDKRAPSPATPAANALRYAPSLPAASSALQKLRLKKELAPSLPIIASVDPERIPVDQFFIETHEKAAAPTAGQVLDVRSGAAQGGAILEWVTTIEIAMCRGRRLERFLNGAWQHGVKLCSYEASVKGYALLWTTLDDDEVVDVLAANICWHVTSSVSRIAGRAHMDTMLQSCLQGQDRENGDATHPIVLVHTEEPEMSQLKDVTESFAGLARIWTLPDNTASALVPSGEDSSFRCCVCLDATKNTVFFPCRHLCSCTDCSIQFTRCPLCRVKVEHRVEVYA
ncbi:E3 ubiquitin-protein ligase SPL1 [Diplonema papillatum]|nr:E3 ubiquitin-protein ligase SPL1 [Diplonema papillatum]|eukprot:gene12934-19950_t